MTRHARGRPTPEDVATATGRPPCAEALAGWRLANGWSQSGLALALGLKRSVVKRAEGGDLGDPDYNDAMARIGVRSRNWERVKAALPSPRHDLHSARLNAEYYESKWRAECQTVAAISGELREARADIASMGLHSARLNAEYYESKWRAECQTVAAISGELREARADIASMRETLRAALKSRDALRRSAPDLVAAIATTSHGWSITPNGRGYMVEARLPLSDDEAHRLMREGREAFEDMCSISDEREVFEVGVGDEVDS